jgi:phosphohistidine swiveling domain-containing protein
LENALKEAGFTFTVDQMFRFISDGISLRERAKFEFTKAISDVLLLIGRLGKECSLDRDDLAFLDIEQVRQLGLHSSGHSIGEELRKIIAHGREWFGRAQTIKIPHLILKPQDIDVMVVETSRPNFVTLKKAMGKAINVTPSTDPTSLEGNIVLIERADPGFDWVFLRNIAGLVTKYGGAASHMTIRAAEFGVPAAIGCGEVLFNKLSRAQAVELDCLGKRIHAV